MRFAKTDIPGVTLVTPDRFDDERGFFARSWGKDEFEANGLNPHMVQRNFSYNRVTGTLRGMHHQCPPHAEVKLISCLAGAIFDVAVDIRPDSPTFGKWFGAELRPDRGEMLYIPEGCAHGFLTLEPDTMVEYLISAFYAPQAARGVRWNDPFFGIHWPGEPVLIAERDRTYPDFKPD